MNTEIKLAMLAILSVTMLTAITVASGTSLVTPVFAKKKNTNLITDVISKLQRMIKTYQMPITLLQSDQSQNDSNIIDEENSLEEAQTETDNSASSIDSQAMDPFSLVGI